SWCPTRALSPRPICRHSKAEAEALVLRRVGIAQRAACAVGVEEPAAAADHALLARRGPVRIDVGGAALGIGAVPVRGPLPHVAVHVGEPPWVEWKGAGRSRLLAEL